MSVPNVQWKTPDDGQRNCPRNPERVWKLSSKLHDICQCRMYSGELLMMGRGTARNM